MNRAELVKKLELVGHALAAHNLVPLFQCYCFTGKVVNAYNDALAVIAPCKLEQAFAVNGKTLLGLLTNSHAEEVEFSIEDKNDLSIKTGKSRFKLPYFGPDEFLFKKPSGEYDATVTIDETLLSGLEACLLTSSSDMAQPKLLGVSLLAYGENMALYSCDGDALTRYITKAKAIKNVNYLMPNSFCEVLVRIFKETEAKEGELQVNSQWAYASMDSGFQIYGRLIEVEKPVDYEELITKTVKGEIDFSPLPKGIDYALSRARVIADPDSAKTVLDVAEGKLHLHTETHMGTVKDVLVYPQQKTISANVSAAMVQRAIGLCDEMAVLERCTVYRKGTTIFMVVSNMG